MSEKVQNNMSSVVIVNQGTLEGKECISCKGKKYHSFEGIPYAKPPVGKLRFRDPEPPESWFGARDATKPGHKCLQMDPYANGALQGSEDCLYLNVYTPVLPAERHENLPVVFFVHGGRFLVGYGDYYRPDYFVQKDVILVTVNYRLHIFGFLCLNIPEVPGNAACKDVIMALKWVKSNIKFFNGDENNVTVFGESAGAGLVTSFLTTKMADGLVNKIMAQSGSCLSDLYLIEEDPIEKAISVASRLGKELTDEKSLYEFLVNVPAEELVYIAMMAELSRPPHIINSFFLPVIEKKFDGIERFFEEYPLKVFTENRFKKIPVLLGLNSHEGALFLRKNDEGNIQYITDVQKMIPRYLNLPYNSPDSVRIANALKEFYFGSAVINDKTKEEYVNLIGDVYFNRDIILLAEYIARHSNMLYLYYCKFSGNMNTRVLKNLSLKGASHGDMLPYQFYRKNKAALCDQRDQMMVELFIDAFSRFAKTGVPSSSHKIPKWLPYSTGGEPCMIIDEEMQLGLCPVWDRVHFWIKNMGPRAKL